MNSINFSIHGLYIVDAVLLDTSRLLCLTRDVGGGRVISGFNVVHEKLHINGSIIVFNFETRIVEK